MTARKYLRNCVSPKKFHDVCWGLAPKSLKGFGNYKKLPKFPKKLLTFGDSFGIVEVMEGRTQRTGQRLSPSFGTLPAMQGAFSQAAVYGGNQ